MRRQSLSFPANGRGQRKKTVKLNHKARDKSDFAKPQVAKHNLKSNK